MPMLQNMLILFTCYCLFEVSKFWCVTQDPVKCDGEVSVDPVELHTKRKEQKP